MEGSARGDSGGDSGGEAASPHSPHSVESLALASAWAGARPGHGGLLAALADVQAALDGAVAEAAEAAERAAHGEALDDAVLSRLDALEQRLASAPPAARNGPAARRASREPSGGRDFDPFRPRGEPAEGAGPPAAGPHGSELIATAWRPASLSPPAGARAPPLHRKMEVEPELSPRLVVRRAQPAPPPLKKGPPSLEACAHATSPHAPLRSRDAWQGSPAAARGTHPLLRGEA